MNQLIHYSTKPITKLKPKHNTNDSIFKPIGLWVSDESCATSWYTWCTDNDFDDLARKHKYHITLKDNHNVLLLTTVQSLKDFTKQYMIGDRLSGYIDWETVASKHNGIIITPYQWSLRLDLMWYYTWDCASGCIWNPVDITLKELPNASTHNR